MPGSRAQMSVPWISGQSYRGPLMPARTCLHHLMVSQMRPSVSQSRSSMPRLQASYWVARPIRGQQEAVLLK